MAGEIRNIIKGFLQRGMDKNLVGTDGSGHGSLSLHRNNSNLLFAKHGQQGGDDPPDAILFVEVRWQLIDSDFEWI